MALVSERRISKVQIFLFGFVAWFASGSLPLLALSEPPGYDQYGLPIQDEASHVYSYVAFFIIGIALWIVPSLVQKAFNYVTRTLPIRAIIATGMLQALVAAALGLYTSTAYACLLLFCIVICLAFWCLPERHRVTFYKSVLVMNLVYVVLAFALYGAPQNRWIGGIHPNLFSQASIIMSFSALMILKGWKRAAIVLLSLGIAISVDSRYAVVSVSMMCFGLILLEANLRLKLLSLISGVVALATSIFTGFFAVIFSIDDAERGLSSGISGRSLSWEDFLPQLSERPFLGYGFRNSAELTTTHNGFLQFMLENGLIISALFFSALLGILVSNVFSVWRSLPDHTFQAHEGRVVLVTIVMIFFAANLQPQLVNFGDQFGPLTLLVLLRVPTTYRSLFRWRSRAQRVSRFTNASPIEPLGS
jgi:O-antigen ligase